MWAIARTNLTQKIQIIVNAWSEKLKKVSGIDGVLAAGIQGVKLANAAEILRYTDSGWSEQEAKKCEESFMKAWHPTIQHYAYFANETGKRLPYKPIWLLRFSATIETYSKALLSSHQWSR